MIKEILQIEELSINAFPAILTELYDGWILRYSNGYTYRGNSVNPLYSSTIELEDKIKYCECKYFEKGLPCVYKITENVEKELDHSLEKLGYTMEKSADIMIYQLNKNINTQVEDVKITLDITEEWLDGFLKLNGTTEETIKSTAKFMLSNIKNKVFCVSINYGEIMIACGLGVLENKKIGLYDINVMEQYRMAGLGTKICRTIINEGIRNGADTAYLQVASFNEKAIHLYRSIGFKRLYKYWYRVKKYPNQ